MNDLNTFYLDKAEPVQGCLIALRAIILNTDSLVTETRKYGMPCFCYKNKMFIYLWTDKKTGEPYLLFVEGKYLDHPDLEQGNRSRMKILRVDSTRDLPVDKINELLDSALELYRNGTIKTK